jgi:3-hydroxy-9,10-secoandrosta-1,3,5(10)-triene-9,17-dione monooxygenase reductase component
MTVATQKEIDPSEFRRALGNFTTGVTIITTRSDAGEPIGVTANSFNSVSLTPPLVLWSLAKKSRSLEAFEGSSHWGVHILSVHQEDLSNRFAKSGEDKFVNLEFADGAGGIPLLSDCCARLQCKTIFRYEGGDHIIFVGEVLEFDRSELPPLVYHAGQYALAASKGKPVTFAATQHDERELTFGEDFIGYLLARAHFQFYAQVMQHAAGYGLTDSEYFFLTILAMRDTQSIEEASALFSYTGYHITKAMAADLQQRGLVTAHERNSNVEYALTNAGRDVTLRVLSAAKALEVDIESKLGGNESFALKHLLKALIAKTDPGFAHPWIRA